MRKYHNNWFYNTALPIILVGAVLGCVAAFLITNQIFFVFMTIVICVCFKSIHHGLENLSLRQRRDYGLIDKNGQYYAGNLSGCKEREIERIRSEIS